MAWWRAVPVYRRAEQALTELELFVLEAAATLGSIDATELTEITGLPGTLLPALARRPARAGALIPAPSGYVVDRGRADTVLRDRTVRISEVTHIDLLYLLQTEELVVAGGGNDPLAGLDNRRLDPAYQIPVPQALAEMTRGRFVADMIGAGRVTGLPSGVHAAVVPEPDEPLFAHGFCPVYRAAAVVSEAASTLRTELTLHGESPRRRRDDPGRHRSVTLALDGLRLAGIWSGATDRLTDGEWRQAWSALAPDSPGDPPPATRVAGLTWRFTVRGRHCDDVSRAGRNLSQAIVLAIRRESHTAHLVLELAAADGHAAARIAVDRAIAEAVSAADETTLQRSLEAVTATVPAECRHLLGHEAVLDRLWQLGQFHLAYALRRETDFHYA
uniref:Uncharacterized protein n=1 Tax=uncultured soil bacterium TaxID=164851 RepID=E2D2M6_9BACT|nr:hypothetical protein [uncultured soil bacterium]